MGAAQDGGVDERVALEQLADVFPDEVVGTVGRGLVVFHQGHPQRAGHARDADVGVELAYLQVVALALDGAFGGQYAHVAAAGELAYDLGRGADDAQDAALGVPLGQVVLLNGAQGLGRGGVASQNDEGTTLLEEVANGLLGIIIYKFVRARTVRRARVVAQIDIVILRKTLTDLL